MADFQLGLYHHPPLMMQGIEARARELGVDLASVALDEITLPAGEDFGVVSDDEEELQNLDPQELETGFASIIVADNLPVIPLKKLENVTRKVFSKVGVIKEGGFWMPVNPDTNMTYGYCFIEYNTSQEAERAREIRSGYKLHKSHILVVNIFDDFKRYISSQ